MIVGNIIVIVLVLLTSVSGQILWYLWARHRTIPGLDDDVAEMAPGALRLLRLLTAVLFWLSAVALGAVVVLFRAFLRGA